MNNPYKLTLIYLTRIPRRTRKGFALGFCLAIGVVMALTGVAMMVRGQSQQTKVLAQKAKAQGVSTAGVAVAQIQQLLNKNKFLAEYNSSEWLNVKDTTKDIGKDFEQISQTCGIQSSEKTAIQDRIISFGNSTWQNINPDDSTQGKYKLISYTKPDAIPGLAKLTVQGLANTTSTTNNVKEAPSQVVVQLPVTKDTDANAPGLWLKDGDMAKKDGGKNNNTVAGDVWLSDCTTDPTAIKLTSTTYTSKYAPIPFPDSTYLPVYDIATIPAVQKNDSGGKPNGLEIKGDLTLPRTGDKPVVKIINEKEVPVYEYVVKTIDLKGNSTLTVKTNDGSNRWQVRFYLQGNIEKGGEIKHSCDTSDCTPTDFQIFGYSTATDSKICTNGNNALEAFIFAPNYTAGAAGAGGKEDSAGGFKGTAWLNSWNKGQACGSQTSNTVVTQTAKWVELLDVVKVDPPILRLLAPSSYGTCEFGSSAEDCK